MTRLSLEESIEQERGTEVPDKDLPVTGQVRRRFLRGDTMRPSDVIAKFGGSNGLAAQIVAQLERLGFEVDRQHDDDGLTTYRVANPSHVPTTKHYDAEKERSRAKRKQHYDAEKGRSRAKSQRERRNVTSAVAKLDAAEAKIAAERAAQTEVVSPPRSRAVAGRETRGMPPLPSLGQPLTVNALALDDDGSISLALSNGTHRWMVTVTGTLTYDDDE